ncbi:hypothetical protein HOY82DRAFT_596580 [Tuber indicum]|nr:hypothetical protein HOY82DRAFT_596580 [Tuber indicum]
MSGRLSYHLATRSAGSPSGPGIRHIGTSSSQASLPLFPPRKGSAADAGASKLPGPNSVTREIHKLETDIEGMKVTTDTLSKRQDVINTYQDNADRSLKWLTQLGYGTGAIFKFYHYDVSQTNQIKAYIREVGGNLESRMERMESRMDKKIGNLESKMDQRMDQMDQKMEKIDQRIGNLESKMEKMDQKIGNLESKMDEISAYLKAKKGWW